MDTFPEPTRTPFSDMTNEVLVFAASLATNVDDALVYSRVLDSRIGTIEEEFRTQRGRSGTVPDEIREEYHALRDAQRHCKTLFGVSITDVREGFTD